MGGLKGAIRLVVELEEFLEALERRTEAKRAPAGASSTGLREGALVPRLGGFRVEMPGGAHFVTLLDGRLDREVVFPMASIPALVKALNSLKHKEQKLVLACENTVIRFRCGGFSTEISAMLM